MKKILFMLIAFCALSAAAAQEKDRFSFATTIGTGVALGSPKSVPVLWQAIGYYNFNSRFSAGIGTGLSFYEKTLIPLFAAAKFNILKPRKFTPYIELGAGYAFAPAKDANGGLYIDPSVGVQYALKNSKRVLISVGYQFQRLERVKRYENQYFGAEFVERPNHNSLAVRAGFVF